MHHLIERTRKVRQFSPAENQKQRREKKTGGKNDLIVDAIYNEATLASDCAFFTSIMKNP